MTTQRIGLSCRVGQAEGYFEPRDCLAQNWATFMAKAMPNVQWLPIPNLGDAAVRFANDWHLTGLILTGGEDVGAESLRDETESALLDMFCAKKRPVLGVCRGMQLINRYLGGRDRKCGEPETHVACRHTLHVEVRAKQSLFRERHIEVNSFHKLCIDRADLAPGANPIALAEDKTVEMFSAEQGRVIAVMWHPERELSPTPWDLNIVSELFVKGRL